jgi:DNA-directed RNA polymerase subunit RPC12/RpoP
MIYKCKKCSKHFNSDVLDKCPYCNESINKNKKYVIDRCYLVKSI